MSAVISAAKPVRFSGQSSMAYAAGFWFLCALVGQWLFAWYIFKVFGGRVLSGHPESINETGLITGFVGGDLLGNVVMLSHILIGGVLSFGGLIQLIPQLRRRAPSLHRWNGRLFLVSALIAAIGGLGLTWIRDSRLSDLGALGISLNGLLIPVAVYMTWRLARSKQFDAHRRWAIRTLILVSGVWTFRLMLMGWLMLNQGMRGNTTKLDGPVDLAISFGCYLLPLAVAEIYFRAQRSSSEPAKHGAALLLTLATVAMAFGIFAAYMMLWSPHLA